MTVYKFQTLLTSGDAANEGREGGRKVSSDRHISILPRKECSIPSCESVHEKV